MLIRSQDKKKIANLANIAELVILNFYEICAVYGNGHVDLGEYSTEEKAKKVLDDIENTYIGTLWTEKDAIIANRVVFEMPQDNEVKV